MKKYVRLMALLMSTVSISWAQEYQQKFEQLGTMLPTPNSYRSASGSPGHEYWQQQADYDIVVTLDDVHKTITGSETITYKNNSPDPLGYLWVQLDQNKRAENSNTYKTQTSRIRDSLAAKSLQAIVQGF